MAEGERQRIFSDRARNGRAYKSSPLLSSARKYQVSEKSSLSESLEAPKSYGTTRNPLQPQCDVKLIGHVLEATDTLQGLAIKYGVSVSIACMSEKPLLKSISKNLRAFSFSKVCTFAVPLKNKCSSGLLE